MWFSFLVLRYVVFVLKNGFFFLSSTYLFAFCLPFYTPFFDAFFGSIHLLQSRIRCLFMFDTIFSSQVRLVSSSIEVVHSGHQDHSRRILCCELNWHTSFNGLSCCLTQIYPTCFRAFKKPCHPCLWFNIIFTISLTIIIVRSKCELSVLNALLYLSFMLRWYWYHLS